MISNDLLKRTPVRLAGAFAILFALTVVALIAVLYLTLVSELRKRHPPARRGDERHAACHRRPAGVRRSRRRGRRGSQVRSRLRQHLPAARRRRLVPRRQRAERPPVRRLGRARPRLAADGRRQGRPRRPLLRHVDAGLQGASSRRQQRPRAARGAAHSPARPRLGPYRRHSARHGLGDLPRAPRAAEDRRVRHDAYRR